MKLRQCVLSSLLGASAALGLMAASPTLADPLQPCEKEWLPSHAPGVCDGRQTSGSVPSDRLIGPVGPSGPAGPLGPGGPADPGGPARPSGLGGPR
jgi:hypothetical protein